LLKEINPSIETTLNETAERFSGFNDIVSEYISDIREIIVQQKDRFITFNISVLKNYLHNKVILFELFRPYGITNALLSDLIKVIQGKTGGQIITGTHRIIKNRKEIVVSDEKFNNEISYTIENIQDFRIFPGISAARNVRITNSFKIYSDPHIASIDSQKVSFPFIIRKWKAGDHFFPLGMNQKKKLSDYFIDNKYSKFDKENTFVLESGGKIIWIIGDRLDNRVRITSSTKKALIIASTKDGLLKIPER
jgi:tRNA(Ile)-lysidine synthase